MLSSFFSSQLTNDINKLDNELSVHKILNYQWVKNKKIFRVEIYKKKYDNLIL